VVLLRLRSVVLLRLHLLLPPCIAVVLLTLLCLPHRCQLLLHVPQLPLLILLGRMNRRQERLDGISRLRVRSCRQLIHVPCCALICGGCCAAGH
jgi:hypothetical protein